MKRADFIKFVSTAGLLTTDEIAAIERAHPQLAADDANALAHHLVEQGKLTKYQAAAIYQGKGKSLLYGEYLVLERIGAGGMGQVFKARHRRMDRIVALKVMSAASIKNADAVKRFEREVRAAAKLSHPNVVHAYDAGACDGAFFLVMEFVEGADFASLLRQQIKLGIKQACGYFEQAARGFAAAHAKGIIHRDVKPGNILVDRAGVVKILDMGLARIEDDGVGGEMPEGELTQSGSVMGTIDYMAPEQALNTHHADAKSDVYGLGCTFYRILAGESVFGGRTLVEKVLAHREHPIPTVRRLRPDAPAALDELIARMLAKNPAERPTMQMVADTLAMLDHLPAAGHASIAGAHAHAPGALAQATEPPSAAMPFPQPTYGMSLPPSNSIGPGVMTNAGLTAGRSRKKTSPLVLLGAAGVFVAVVSVAGWQLLKLVGDDKADSAALAAVQENAGENVPPAATSSASSVPSLAAMSTTTAAPRPTGLGTALAASTVVPPRPASTMLNGNSLIGSSVPVAVASATPQVSLKGRSSIDQVIIMTASPDSVTPSTTTATASNSATSSTTAAAPAEPKKIAVPSTAEQQAALKSIKEIFADDYAGAKSFDQKGALAKKLLEQAKQTTDDPISRYVLLVETRSLATEASEVDPLFDALTALTTDYDVPEAATFVESWTALLKRPRLDPATIQRVFKDAEARFDIGVTDACFDEAKQYGEFALATARRLPNSGAVVKLTTERNSAAAARQKEWPELIAMAEKLKQSPDDAAANLAVARYQALVAEDWKRAFPLFVKCGDELWAKLAAKSLEANETATAQVAVGDAWWDAAQAAKPPLKAELAAGALYWYDLASPSLTGLPKTRVEKRRNELDGTALVHKIPPTTLPGFVDAESLVSISVPANAMPVRTFGDPPLVRTPPRAMNGAPTNTTGSPGASSDEERRLAQSLLAAGASVNLRITTPTGTSSFRVTPRGVLPLESFIIDGVGFENLNPATDLVDEADLAMLAALPNLRTLNFFNCRIDDKAFASLKNLPRVETIFLNSIAGLRDEHLAGIRALSNLRNVTISNCPLTDAALVHFKDLANLTSLSISSSQITGVGFGQLSGLSQLRVLNLFGAPITDAGLLQIQRITSLRRLDLANTTVTDAGIPNLRGLAELDFISLRGTQTTDAALRHLEGRPTLRQVVASSRMTIPGAEAFQKAMPGCRIQFPQQ